MHILHRNFELGGNKQPESRRIQNTRHPDYPVGSKPAHLQGDVHHDIERVGNDDDNGVGRLRHRGQRTGFHDGHIGIGEIIPAHAGFAGETCGDDDDIGSGCLGVGIGSCDAGVRHFNGRGLGNVESLPLRHTFNDVQKNDIVGEFLINDPLRGSGADVARTDDGDFHRHTPPAAAVMISAGR